MPPPKTSAQAVPEDAGTAEARMRRALGLGGAPPARPTANPAVQQRPEQARARHRFVRDGEVPVEVVTGPRTPDAAPGGRVATLQAALDGEQAARAGAERSLAEAQAAVRSLQAKLAHAELAHAEALSAERRTRERVEAALREAVAAREQVEGRPSEAAVVRAAVAAPPPRGGVKRVGAGKPASKAPARRAREPEPIKWWLPGWKARAR